MSRAALFSTSVGSSFSIASLRKSWRVIVPSTSLTCLGPDSSVAAVSRIGLQRGSSHARSSSIQFIDGLADHEGAFSEQQLLVLVKRKRKRLLGPGPADKMRQSDSHVADSLYVCRRRADREDR